MLFFCDQNYYLKLLEKKAGRAYSYRLQLSYDNYVSQSDKALKQCLITQFNILIVMRDLVFC